MICTHCENTEIHLQLATKDIDRTFLKQSRQIL